MTLSAKQMISNRQILSVLAAGLLLTAGCSTPSTERGERSPLRQFQQIIKSHGIHLKRSKAQVLAKSSKWKAFGSVSHPYLAPLSGERILLMFYGLTGKEAGLGRAAADWPLYTEDNGLTWTNGNPLIWADGAPPHALSAKEGEQFVMHWGYGWGDTTLSNGLRVGQARQVRPRNSPSGYFYVNKGVWTYDSEIWYGPRDITLNVPRESGVEGNVVISPKGLQLPDGSLLLLVYARGGNLSGGSNYHYDYKVVLFRSVDEGVTYDYYSTVADVDSGFPTDVGPNEPGMVLLSNGDLLCVMRSGIESPYMLQARSRDQGVTWELSKINRPGVMPKLLEMGNGLLVLAYGRPGNHLMFSRDHGETWVREVNLTARSEKTSGYVDILEVESGKLLVTYDVYSSQLARFWLGDVPERANAVLCETISVTLD